jgi:hypothetical protein
MPDGHRPHHPDRHLRQHPLRLGARDRASLVLQDLHGHLDRLAVAHHQHFQPQGLRSHPLCFRRGTKTAGSAGPVIEKLPLHEQREPGGHRTTAFEAAQRRIVAFQQLDLHVGEEILDVLGRHLRAAAHRPPQPFEQRKMGDQKVFGIVPWKDGDSIRGGPYAATADGHPVRAQNFATRMNFASEGTPSFDTRKSM